MTDKPPEELDAWSRPRRVVEGCQHRMGCRCEPPFWLRLPTAAEDKRFRHPPSPADVAGRTE